MKAENQSNQALLETFALVSDENGNRAIFKDGCVPAEVNGVPVEIISAGLRWEEAHDLL